MTAGPAVESEDGITLAALSKRLGVAHQRITAWRRRPDFCTWIQSLDPAGYSWSYCERLNTYRCSIRLSEV